MKSLVESHLMQNFHHFDPWTARPPSIAGLYPCTHPAPVEILGENSGSKSCCLESWWWTTHESFRWVSSPWFSKWDKWGQCPLITGIITQLLSGMNHQVDVHLFGYGIYLMDFDPFSVIQWLLHFPQLVWLLVSILVLGKASGIRPSCRNAAIERSLIFDVNWFTFWCQLVLDFWCQLKS